MFDLLIRGGTVVDGTGSVPIVADIAVQNGKIATVGRDLEGDAQEVIDAHGLTVTPGFIDVHTHLDGQVFWDPELEITAAHGVTTVVLGNCGVGLAPAAPDGRTSLIEIMEGVEDVPAQTLVEGVPFDWESFPQFLDRLDSRRWAIDVAAMATHGAVREYVMAAPGARNEPAFEEDVAKMAAVVREAVEAGAVGLSTNRLPGHASIAGRPVAGTYATFGELKGLADAVVAGGGYHLEVAPAGLSSSAADGPVLHDLAVIAGVSREANVPTSFLLLQTMLEPGMWRNQLEFACTEQANGTMIVPQIASRPFGMLIGFSTRNPFILRPTFHRLASLPLEEMYEELCRPENREAILSEKDDPSLGNRLDPGRVARMSADLANLFPLGKDLDYEPPPERSVKAIAESTGADPFEVVYDFCMGEGEPGYLLNPVLNYASGNHDPLYEQLQTPGTLLGLADAGAHSRSICDASQPTTMLTHWIRDRQRGPKIDLALSVKKLSSEPAEAMGFKDRGVITPGKRADLNVIDLESLRLHMPKAVDDLPGGGRRLLQPASGYKATIVAGTVSRRDDQPTGALPGRLARRQDA